ncbi:MAG: hypothetical protein ABI128_00230 [Rhodanobacter sp.]
MHPVDLADIPVFGHRHRQVGVIQAPADVADAAEVTPAQWLSHCMNDAVHWTAHATDDGELNRQAGALGLWRVPLVNHQHQVCDMVVLGRPFQRQGRGCHHLGPPRARGLEIGR